MDRGYKVYDENYIDIKNGHGDDDYDADWNTNNKTRIIIKSAGVQNWYLDNGGRRWSLSK